MSVRAIYYEEKHIGEKIKKTKTQFLWKFELDGMQHQLEFLVSKLSGKKRVIQDGVVLLEQQKIIKSFQFPFNIGKHMWNLSYSMKGAKLRIDNWSFSDLYQGKNFEDGKSASVHKRPEVHPRSKTEYNSKKKISDGWNDIKKAKDSVKYADIPDPYSNEPKKEEVKEKISLKDLGRRKKTGTVFQKK